MISRAAVMITLTLAGCATTSIPSRPRPDVRRPFLVGGPEDVEVLDSGTLAISTGPVRDPKGALFATFTSIWRLEDSGKWRIIFDKGNQVCPPRP
jgi:hypothetical protein